MEFRKITIPMGQTIFSSLTEGIRFENSGKGRRSNNIVKVNNHGYPIVRTTTKRSIAPMQFNETHNEIIREINASIRKDHTENMTIIDFNHAMIEVYDQSYRKMKYHSDQCVDIEKQSIFALFSCYNNPEQLSENKMRVLYIIDKETEKESSIILSHNSVILFSFSTNKKYKHKIIMKSNHGNYSFSENEWLGITFRTSKSIVHSINDKPFLNGEIELKLASEEEEREFYRLKGEENRSMEFDYPKLDYTLSPADLIRPVIK